MGDEPDLAAPRHAPGWYDQSMRTYPLEVGDRVLVRCDGGRHGRTCSPPRPGQCAARDEGD
jgi:hypothetical protein